MNFIVKNVIIYVGRKVNGLNICPHVNIKYEQIRTKNLQKSPNHICVGVESHINMFRLYGITNKNVKI